MSAGRRAFLGQLAQLPLIGGGIALIGKPTAAAVPVTERLLVEYSDWLGWERHRICSELYGHCGADQVRRQEHTHSITSLAHDWHFKDGPAPPACTRAALVLSTVGLDWREG